MIIKADDPELIDKAVSSFRRGEVVVFPTDTVYGLGTLATANNSKNIEKIFNIKKRPLSKPLSILVTIEMLPNFIDISDKTFAILKEIWPARITIILKIKENPSIEISDILNSAGNNTIACRVPAHEDLLKILEKLSIPIIGTSANISGTSSSNDFNEVYFNLREESIDLWINQGKLPQSIPSTLIDLTDDQNPILIRKGDYDFSVFWEHYHSKV